MLITRPLISLLGAVHAVSNQKERRVEKKDTKLISSTVSPAWWTIYNKGREDFVFIYMEWQNLLSYNTVKEYYCRFLAQTETAALGGDWFLYHSYGFPLLQPLAVLVYHSVPLLLIDVWVWLYDSLILE